MQIEAWVSALILSGRGTNLNDIRERRCECGADEVPQADPDDVLHQRRKAAVTCVSIVVVSGLVDGLFASVPESIMCRSSWLQLHPRSTGFPFNLKFPNLPVINPNFDQENDDERRGETDGVQRGGGHRVWVVRPVDGLCVGKIASLVSDLSLSRSGQTSSLQKNPFSCGFPATAKTAGGKFCVSGMKTFIVP